MPIAQNAAVRALLTRIVDYAGLFPPAKLDMATTVRNYAGYLKSPEAWVLGRLIVPVARLEDFEDAAAALLDASDEPWSLSALTAPAGTPQFDEDLAKIESFNIRHEDDQPAQIDVIEAVGESSAAIDAALNHLPPDLFAFFEIPIDRDPRGLIATLVDGEAGAKVRTGGVNADAYPAPEHLARFIAACAAADVPFKATAGLHHPLRHFSPSFNAHEFGFLNVFFAGCLAHSHQLGEEELAALLRDEDASNFVISDEGIAWRDHRLPADNIEDVRQEFAVSFGSCSFDEPREGLRALRWL